MTDQEIRDALRVDPSPEFLARVRTRIANEPAPSAWRWSWTVAAVGALAAMVLIAVVMLRPKQEKPSAPDVVQAFPPSRTTESDKAPAGPSASAHATPVVSGFPPALQSSSAELRRGQAEAQSAKAGSRTMSQGAEILLDPAETQALRRLIAGVRDGRVDLTAAQHSTPPLPMELAPHADIVIDPITIEPIAPPSGAEGARP
jgi:hypothetical protein